MQDLWFTRAEGEHWDYLICCYISDRYTQNMPSNEDYELGQKVLDGPCFLNQTRPEAIRLK